MKNKLLLVFGIAALVLLNGCSAPSELCSNEKYSTTTSFGIRGKVEIELDDESNDKLHLAIAMQGDEALEDISDLSCLTKLVLHNANITDISPISNLTNLGHLALGYSNISNVLPLSNLTNLEILNLANNNISDVLSLYNLKKLTFLNLTDNPISDSDCQQLKQQLPTTVVLC